jgi:hypothetical protein
MTPKAICHRKIQAARAIIADERTFQKPLTPSVSGYRTDLFTGRDRRFESAFLQRGVSDELLRSFGVPTATLN